MTREITVITPENVTISYELAGLGTRFLAYLLDELLILACLLGLGLVVLLVFLGLAQLGIKHAPIQSLDLTGAAFILIAAVSAFVAFSGYFIYFEAARNGQTPGKKIMGLRVVREEGSPIDSTSAVIRNLVRIIEIGLGYYTVSIISIMISSKYKRLGDYAAGTIVVKERIPSVSVLEAQTKVNPPTSTINSAAAFDVHLLNKEQVAAIKRFTERRYQLAPLVQEDVARQIAEPIISHLGINPPENMSFANLLEELYKQCVEERGAL